MNENLCVCQKKDTCLNYEEKLCSDIYKSNPDLLCYNKKLNETKEMIVLLKKGKLYSRVVSLLLSGEIGNDIIWDNFATFQKLPQDKWAAFIINRATLSALKQARLELHMEQEDEEI